MTSLLLSFPLYSVHNVRVHFIFLTQIVLYTNVTKHEIPFKNFPTGQITYTIRVYTNSQYLYIRTLYISKYKNSQSVFETQHVAYILTVVKITFMFTANYPLTK